MSPNDTEIIELLYHYFLDKSEDIGYFISWDTYLVMHGHTGAFLSMVYKTNDQQDRILEAARDKADKLRNSKLWKVLK